MPIYDCDNCNYSTTIKTHYNKHLKTQKHINKLKEIDGKLIEKLSNPQKSSQPTHYDSQINHIDSQPTHYDSQMTHNDSQINTKNNEIFNCKYCNKSFTRFNNLNRHIKNYCKIRKENDERIMEIENKYKEEIEKLHQKIEFLMEQKQGPTTIINIDKQINLNNYGSEDLSHITENFKDQMLKIPFVAIPKMIEEVHFSEKKPQNNNIKLTNKKENYVKVYQGDKWIFKDRKSTIKQLMDDKYTIIDNHYEEYKEEPKPKHVDSQYKKFKDMYNEGERDLHNEIRLDCELLLLNNMEK